LSALFADLTRTDFVRYAGASGDLTAVHFDDRVAQLHGAPVAFAMGMLSGAFLGHVLSDLVALDGEFDLAMRFRDQVWPGDSLTVSAEVESVDEDAAVILLNCARDDGTSVTTGWARVGRTRQD
jgi:acyl dehydratase